MENNASYPITNIPFTDVKIDDGFWSPRIETNRAVTIPYDFQKCEETGRIANFAIAGGLQEGAHEGIFYNDSDVFKVVEGASYSLHLHPDSDLDHYLEKLIAKFGAAQEEDGYLYTARTIAEKNGTPDILDVEREGSTRWSNLRVNHELYNVGHMYEAAVAHFQATGRRTFLDIALKNADLIDGVFGIDKRRDVPGHQEIEIGLAKLYLVTGDERYLHLAKFFLDERGHYNGRGQYGNFDDPAYTQDHLPVLEQKEALGHAVRAVYMYCGMADVAALTGEQSYIDAIDRIWENVIYKKLYVTGGIGARHHGEAFGDDYELPNATAYNETCAALANVFWNQRMFQLHGDAKYIDVLERSLYNGFLSGIAFGGDRFFYVNPLAYDGKTNFNRDDSKERLPWFNCSCCPTNVVRLFPSLGGYIYARASDQIYVNLFIGSQFTFHVNGSHIRIQQESNFPWEGDIALTVEPAQPTDFTLCIRIPGWARNQPVPGDLYRYSDDLTEEVTLSLNGQPVSSDTEGGYAHITRTWQAGDRLELNLPMPARRVIAHPKVTENEGKVVLERGPLVYCLEGTDNGGHALDATLTDDIVPQALPAPHLLNGVTVIQWPQSSADGSSTFTAIPYYAWAHREPGEMSVWMNRRKD